MKRQVVKASEQVVIEYSEELVSFYGVKFSKGFLVDEAVLWDEL